MVVVHARCIAHAFDSVNAVQYWPGQEYDLDLANKDQRKLVWLRTPRGKWIFDFDRANSSNTDILMFFCKECGQPFELLNELGTHSRDLHSKNDKTAKLAKAESDAEVEAMLLEQAKTKTLAQRHAEIVAKQVGQ